MLFLTAYVCFCVLQIFISARLLAHIHIPLGVLGAAVLFQPLVFIGFEMMELCLSGQSMCAKASEGTVGGKMRERPYVIYERDRPHGLPTLLLTAMLTGLR